MKKSGKNLLGDRGKKKIYVEGKQSIAIWDMHAYNLSCTVQLSQPICYSRVCV
jgi:hypothetical protein